MEEWRILLYPLGLVSALVFGARFIVQWLQSERQHQSIVPASFWVLSLVGNSLLALHAFIQIQFPICAVQACNGVIAWRNLNLMQPRCSQLSFQTVLFLLGGVLGLTICLFFLQDYLIMRDGNWFRVPVSPWQAGPAHESSLYWHALGMLSYILFSSRFWIQWWLAEKAQASQLPLSFWWISLVGALLSMMYFSHIQDTVNLIGPLVGLIPYIRNLMLIRRSKAQKIS
ncbi:MAG: lipid-A-disaccharide synthase N-terminal domain-containing protein [Candidatus Protochlamydia sp.]|nr:lipid-A-disaccharide synthase N-terminal domain-containing protein [Candidatus Protochlamydia sp.]